MSSLRRLVTVSATALGIGILSSMGLEASAGTSDSIQVDGNIPSTLNIEFAATSTDLTTNIAAATPGTYRTKLSNFTDLGTNDADGFTVSFSSSASFASSDGDDTISYGLAIGPNTGDGTGLTYATSGQIYDGSQGNMSDQALFIELTQLDSDTADAGAYTLNLSLTVADK